MADLILRPYGKAEPPQPVNFLPVVQKDELAFLGDRAAFSRPGIVDLADTMDKPRDWDYSYINPNHGFMGVRWCPSWIRTTDTAARWQPAGADVFRVQRKGEAGAEARTLVLTCAPNSLAIPAGDPIVIWRAQNDTTVLADTTLDLFGYTLQLKTKINISACTPSPLYAKDGRQIIEIDTGGVLPVIDYLPPLFIGENGIQRSSLQLRHWSFYANSATKQLRLPFPRFFQNTKRIVKSQGVSILGGNDWSVRNYDWSKDYLNFGASLVEELFKKECEGLADSFGNIDPMRLAVELENNVVHPWANSGSIPGFKVLLNDVWYPTARKAWGQERTLIVKGPYGADGTLNQFDWSPPTGERAHLAIHTQDTGINSPNGPVTFANISQSDWLAGALHDKISQLGFSGGGITSLQVNNPHYTVEKAKKLGRALTSFYSKNLYVWYYCHMNSNPDLTANVADVFSITGHRMEALYPEMRLYAEKAGSILI